MTDLQTLLDRAVDHRVEIDVEGDLTRGHRALRRRRRTVAGAALALAVLGGAAAGLARTSSLPLQFSHSASTVHAGAFEIPAPPEGWSVQAADRSMVVIAPAGLPKVDLHDPNLTFSVKGKMVLEYRFEASDELAVGPPIGYDGRAFYDNDRTGTDARIVTTRTGTHDWLSVQEAPQLGWTLHQLVAFLDAVVVSPDAVPAG